MASRKSVSFGDWTPSPEPEQPPAHDRQRFAGLTPEDAASRLTEIMRTGPVPLREVTLRNKRDKMRQILADFALRGKDLASISRDDVTVYRAYLKDLVTRGEYSEDSAGSVIRVWNSTMRSVFGELGKPGDGLIVKGFKQNSRKFRRLGEKDLDALSVAFDQLSFRCHVQREALRTYIEVATCAGPRIGSLLKNDKFQQPGVRLGDIDWRDGTLYLRHMKNLPDHVIVLTDRAVGQLRLWVPKLQAAVEKHGAWQGLETPLFTGRTGKPVTVQWVNRMLKKAGKVIGWNDKLSTHILRKSVGTIIGSRNPRLAQMQLGITRKVFERHYNDPLLEDRLNQRHVLPGGRDVAARPAVDPEPPQKPAPQGAD